MPDEQLAFMGDAKPLMRLRRLLTHGNIWLSALSVISSQEAYAYALPEKIRQKFGFSPSRLMTYFVLYKLEGEGLVSSSLIGRRKYYKITKKGKEALKKGKALLCSLSKKL